VSTEEQSRNGTSLAGQREAIAAECRQRGWKLVEVREDAGFSGKSLRRPGIRAALEAVESGRADALVVSRLDRLTRSLRDFTALLERARREGWARHARAAWGCASSCMIRGVEARVEVEVPLGQAVVMTDDLRL